MNEIAKAPPKSVQSLADLEEVGALTRVGLKLPTNLTPERYEALGEMLGHADQAIQWAIGDWIAYGEAKFGEESYQYIEALGISEVSRSQHVLVASHIPVERRRPELTWSHHRAVHHLEPDEQDRWLQLSVDNQWPKYELMHKIKEARTSGSSPEPPGRNYVVEAVLNAAEAVWDARLMTEDGFFVKGEPMMDLGYALGEGTREA